MRGYLTFRVSISMSRAAMQGLELQDAKDSSLTRRKQLAELTKEFRKK